MSESQNRTLPQGWCQVEIDEVAEIVTGNTPPKNDPQNYGSSYPWVRPPDLGSYAPILDTPQQLSEKGAAFARLLPPGAVLVSCIGTLGRVGIAGTTLATNQQINSLVFSNGMEPRYGFYFCQTLGEWLTANSSATTIAIINKSRFSNAPFLLAPTKEQTRIVAEIERQFTRLDAAVAALRRVHANLKRYRAAVLKAACEGRLVPTEAELARKEGRSYETGEQLLARILKERRFRWESDQLAKMRTRGSALNNRDHWKKYEEPQPPDATKLPSLPEDWTWATVRQVGQVQLGRQRAPQHHKGEHMRPYLRVANVFEDRIDISDVLEMNFTPSEFRTYQLHDGDILLNEGQSLELIGRPAIYRNQFPGACFQNTLVRFRANPGVEPRYALAVFLSYLHNQRFQQIAKWTTNIAHLGAERFAELEFPLPPTDEQIRIADTVEDRVSLLRHMEIIAAINSRRADRLRQSILKRAFEGKLVPQDPSDEPASVLLERIRTERARAIQEPSQFRPRRKAKVAVEVS